MATDTVLLNSRMSRGYRNDRPHIRHGKTSLTELLHAAGETHGPIAARHAAHGLATLGIGSPSELTTVSRHDLARLPKCGLKTLKLIEHVAEQAGVALRSDPPALRHSRRLSPQDLRDITIVRIGRALRNGHGISLGANELAALAPIFEPVLEDFEQVR